MPEATAADKELLTAINPVIRKFPIMTSTPKGEPPRSGSNCVILMVGNMNKITASRNYIEQRNRQRDRILQILGIGPENIYVVSAINYFFNMEDTKNKDIIKHLDDEVKSLQLSLNSLHELSRSLGGDISSLDRERLRGIGDKLRDIANRLTSSEAELKEGGELLEIQIPGDVRSPAELIEALVKLYMEIYKTYPDTSYGKPNPFTPEVLLREGRDLEKNLRDCAEFIRITPSPSDATINAENNNTPGDFARAVYLGLTNLNKAAAAAAAPAPAPVKKGWFGRGGRKTRRHGAKRSKKTRGRRHTRSRR